MHPKMKYIYVGVDCHKKTHTAAIINCFNEKLDLITFKTNTKDYELLMEKVNSHITEGISAVFGLEDTKHLGNSLARYLLSKNQIVKHVNSCLTYSERRNQPIINKTDEIDALAIAKITLDKFNDLPNASNEDLYWTLKQLMKMRKSLTYSNIEYKNKLHAQLLHHYPNYREFFFHFDSNTALSFWENCPSPASLENTTIEELAELLKRTFGNNNATAKSEHILNLVKEYDYLEIDYAEERNYLIGMLVRQIRYNNEQEEKIDKEIETLMTKIDCKLNSIKGLSYLTSAQIMSEIGDISRFSSKDKLAKYAGISPISFSSGTKDKQLYNSYGNRRLNSMIYQLAVRSITVNRYKVNPHNPIFFDYYQKKISEGKTKKQALNFVMRRLINIIYWVLKNNKEYTHPQDLSDQCLDKWNKVLEKQKEKNKK